MVPLARDGPVPADELIELLAPGRSICGGNADIEGRSWSVVIRSFDPEAGISRVEILHCAGRLPDWEVLSFREKLKRGSRHETSPPKISVLGRWHCRAAGCAAHCIGDRLSDSTGAIVVGYAAGGSADIVARLTGQWLSDRLGQQFIIENRTGAGTNIATEAVVNSPPDGYTLLLVTSANFINATLYEKLNFTFIRDITPVASLSREPAVMVVHPSVPANTVPEFITYAKANPGKINFASGGIGAPSHVFGELFKMSTGVDLVHVPYRGAGPAVTGLLGNPCQRRSNTSRPANCARSL